MMTERRIGVAVDDRGDRVVPGPGGAAMRRVRGIACASIAGAIAVLGAAASATGVTITEYSAGISARAGLGDIAVDHEGRAWFTEPQVARVGRITPDGVVTEYVAKGPERLIPGKPTTLAVGVSGNVWASGPDLRYVFLGFNRNGEPIRTTDTNACQSASQLAAAWTAPDEVVAASDSCGGAESVGIDVFQFPQGRLAPGPGAARFGEHDCDGANNGPFVAAAPNGTNWLSCYAEGGYGLVEIPRGGSPTWHSVGLKGIPGPVTVTQDGTVWFTQSQRGFAGDPLRDAIGRIDPRGTLTTFDSGLTGMGFHDTGVHGITHGPDGAVWFTEPDADRIGRITGDGVITEFRLAAGTRPQGIARGAGRTLWFVEAGANRVGKIDLNEAPVPEIGVSGSLVAPAQLTLTGAQSRDVDGSIVDFRWDLGDGATASGRTVTHTYPRPGAYDVDLVVRDNDGGSGRVRRRMIVTSPTGPADTTGTSPSAPADTTGRTTGTSPSAPADTARQVTDPAPTAPVDATSATSRWTVGYAGGVVVVRGRVDHESTLGFTLHAGARRLSLGNRRVPAGFFVTRFAVRPGLSSGIYVLKVSGPRTEPPLSIDPVLLEVPRPARGVVDRAQVVDERGHAVSTVRPGDTTRLHVRFRFAVLPGRGSTLEARWTTPFRRPAHPETVDTAPAWQGRFVMSSLHNTGGRPLPRGVYTCELWSARVRVGRITMRIG